MSQSFSIRNSFIGGGVKVDHVRTIPADNLIYATEDIPAGVAGTAGNAGVMTLAEGHGFVDNDVVCVSGTFGSYYNGVVSSAGATSITVSSGAGDSLPTAGAVVICKKTELDIVFSGSDAVVIFLGGPVALTSTLEDAGGVELVRETSAGGAYQWDLDNGDANPVTGDSIIKAHVYNRGTVASTVSIMVGYNN